MSLFDLRVYYISFYSNKNIENHYKKYGFKHIFHFPAVNGKKLNPEKLLEDKVITVRAYEDLKNGRKQHSGMPSLGAIGCALSHYSLWKKCVDENLPAIVITEEDNRIQKQITPSLEKEIMEAISKPNGMFLSSNNNKIKNEGHRKHFFGTHFYIPSNSACNFLLQHIFPIDIQVDIELAHYLTLGQLNIKHEKISKQSRENPSSIQNICVPCFLPNNKKYYLALTAGIIITIIIIVILTRKFLFCKSSRK